MDIDVSSYGQGGLGATEDQWIPAALVYKCLGALKTVSQDVKTSTQTCCNIFWLPEDVWFECCCKVCRKGTP